MVNNENLDELSSIEKLSDEDLFKAFLTEGNQISMSDVSGSASYNESDSFNSTPEGGYTQSSSDEIGDTPPHDTSPYSIDSNREFRQDNRDNQHYAHYERPKQPSPPSRANQARFPQRQYPSNQVIEHPQVLYPSSFGRTQLPIASNAHRVPIQSHEPTVYKPPVLGAASQSYVQQQQPIANYYRPAPYQPPTDPLKSQVEAQLESVLNDRIKQQQLQALQQAQMLFNASTPSPVTAAPMTVTPVNVMTPVNTPMTPVMAPVIQKPVQQQQLPVIRPAPRDMSYSASPYESQSDTPAYLPLPPLSTPNSRKRQREGEEERTSAGEEDDEDRMQKRQKRLIKNRESAQLSRIRKKQYVDELEKRLSVVNEHTTRLEWRVEELQLENSMLRDDNGYLRELVNTQPGYAEHLRARDSARQHEYQQQRTRLQEQRTRNSAIAPNAGNVRQQQATSSMKAANVCLLIVIFAFGLFINSPDATSTILGPKNIVFVRDHSARSLTGLDVTQLPHVNPTQHDASYGHDDRGEGEHNASHAVFCPAARHVLVKSGQGSDIESNTLSFVMKLNEFKRNDDFIKVMYATDTSQPYLHVQCSTYTLSAVEMVDLDDEAQIKSVTVDTRPKQAAQAA
jgi:hypothetical protein